MPTRQKIIKKIMLIAPPVTRPKDFSAKISRVTSMIPLGIAYLAAVLEKTGKYEIRILNALLASKTKEGIPLNNGERIRYGLADDEIEKRIREFSPDVIGVSCLFASLQGDMVNICKMIKKIGYGIQTIVGGAHAGNIAEELISSVNEIDFVVIGESEESFPSILDALGHGTSFSDIDGIAFREDGAVGFNPKTKYIGDLDSIPFPAHHLLNMEAYFEQGGSHGLYRKTPYTQMITSRGCIYKCTFCALNGHWGRKQRMRSPQNILDEIEYLIKDYGIKEIHFEDENMTADKQRAIELFDGMVERKFNILWHAPSGTAVNTLDDDIIEKMATAGCYSVTLGIESGNQEVITKLMKKPVNLKKVPGIVKKIRETGMHVCGFFMFGYPGETKENMEETIEYIMKIELDWVYFSIFSPLPKSKAYDLCVEKGYIKEGDFDPIRGFHSGIVRTPEFDPVYLSELRERAIIDTCFKNNPNLLKYDIDKAIENFESVVQRYPHFDFANFYLGEAYLKKGEKQKAIDLYKKTLDINPGYKEAKSRLEEIGVEI